MDNTHRPTTEASIEQCWARFSRDCLSSTCTPTQREMIRATYYAGAGAVLSMAADTGPAAAVRAAAQELHSLYPPSHSNIIPLRRNRQ